MDSARRRDLARVRRTPSGVAGSFIDPVARRHRYVALPCTQHSGPALRSQQEAPIPNRTRRIDNALQTQKRAMWTATALVLLVGVLVLVWVVSPAERRRRGAMDGLDVGDPASRLVQLLGEPAARCPAGDLAQLRGAFPPGWPGASVESALGTLAAATAERWVYPIGRGSSDCAPLDGRTEVGVDAERRVLWYVTVTGKTPVQLPPEVSPASPGGSPLPR